MLATLSATVGYALIDFIRDNTDLNVESDVVFHHAQQSDAVKLFEVAC